MDSWNEFSSLQFVEPAASAKFEFPLHIEPVTCVVEDEEFRRLNITLEYFRPFNPTNTLMFLNMDLLKRVVTSALDNRLRLIVKNMVEFQHDDLCDKLRNTIFSGGVSVNSVVPGLSRFSITLSLSQILGSQTFGINVLARELVRLISFGFTHQEVENAKKNGYPLSKYSR